MPNFEVGGIDVRAEPDFTGFARETKARLTEIERRLEPFNVLAEPKLVKDFKAKLRTLVAKATAKFSFDVEATPALVKGFQKQLRTLVAAAQRGVRFDVEFTPALTRGFKVDLREKVAKGQAGIRTDIEFSPALAKGFKTELRAATVAAQTGVRSDVEFRPDLARGFSTELREKVQAAARFASSAVHIEPRLVPGFRTKLREQIAASGTGAVNVPAKLEFANKAALRLQLRTAIQAAAEGLRVRVAIDLDPDITAFRARLKAAESLERTRFRVPIHANTSALGAELRAGLKKAVAGTKAFARIPVNIVSNAKKAFAPILAGLTSVAALAKKAALAFGLLALGVGAIGLVGVSAAGDYERQLLSLQIVIGSATAGQRIFNDVLTAAKETPFEVPDLTPVVKQLRLAGLSTKELIPSLRIMTDITSALGRSGTNMQKAAIALSKIQGKGKATARELNAISENLPGFSAIASIAKEMGITVPEAFKKMSKGAIPANVAIRGIIKGMKEFKGAAGAGLRAATETFKGALSNFPDLLRIAFFESFQRELPKITAFLGPNGTLIRTIQRLMPTVAKAFVPLADALLNTIADLVPAINALVVSSLPLITSLGAAIGNLGPGLAAIGTALALVFNPLAKVLPGIATSLSKVITAVVAGSRGAFAALGTGLAQLAVGFGKAAEILAPLLGPLLRVLGTVAATLGRILPPLVAALVPAFVRLGPVLQRAVVLFGELVVAFAPILGLVANIAVSLLEQLLPAFEAFKDPAFIAAVGKLVSSFGGFLGAVVGLLPPLVKILVPIATLLATFLSIKGVLPALIAGFVAYKTAVIALGIAQAIATGTGLALSLVALKLAAIVAVAVLVGVAVYQLYKRWKPFHDLVDATWHFVVRFRVALLLLGSAFLIYKVVSLFRKEMILTKIAVLALGKAIWLVTAAQKAAAVSAAIFSAALSANPIGVAVIAIVALGTALFVLYKKWKPFHDLVDATWQFLQRNFVAILVALVAPLALVGLGVRALYRHFGFLQAALEPVVRFLLHLPSHLTAVGKAIYDGLVTGVQAVVRFFQLLPGRVVHALVALGPALLKALQAALRHGQRAIGLAIGAWLAHFIAVPYYAAKALVKLGSVLAQVIRAALGLALNELKALPGQITRVWHALEPGIASGAHTAFFAMYHAAVAAVQATVRFFQLLPGRVVHFLRAAGPVIGRAAVNAIYHPMVAAVQLTVRFFQLLPGRVVHALVALGPMLGRVAHTAFFGIYHAAVRSIQSTLRAFVRFGPDLINGLGRGIKAAAVGFWHALLRIWRGIIDGFKSVLGIGSPSRVMYRLGRDVILGLIRGVGSLAAGLLGFFLRLPGRMVRALGNLGGLLVGAGLRIIGGLADSIERGAGRVLGFFRDLPGNMVRALGRLGSIFFDIGHRIIEGLANGIKRFAPTVINEAKKVADGIWGKLVNRFQPGSRSKVTYQLGLDIGQGLREGIRDSRPSAEKAAQALARSVADAVKKGLSPKAAKGLAQKYLSAASDTGPKRLAEDRTIVGSKFYQPKPLGEFGITTTDGRRFRTAKDALAGREASDKEWARFIAEQRAAMKKWFAAAALTTRPAVTGVAFGAPPPRQTRQAANAPSPIGGKDLISRELRFGASGLKRNDWAELLALNPSDQRKVTEGIVAIAKKYDDGTGLIVASQAKMRDHSIREWVATNKGTNAEAQRWIAQLNGTTDTLTAQQAAKARTVRDQWILSWVQLHGGTAAEAGRWIKNVNAQSSGHVTTQAQDATKVRIAWVQNWVKANGGTVAEATKLFNVVGTKSNAFRDRETAKQALFKERWIANYVRMNGGTQAQATDMFNRLHGKQQAARLRWITEMERQKNEFILKWVQQGKGSVAEANQAWRDHRTAAQVGGDRVGRSAFEALRKHADQVRYVMAAYQNSITQPLNNILAGLGKEQIKTPKARLLNLAKAGLAGKYINFAEGGVIPGPAHVRRDSVPALLAPKEYVVQRKRVDEEGVHKLKALNEGRATIVYKDWPRYATGGQVTELAGGWRSIVAAVTQAGIPHRVISTDRPGARTHATGAVSLHALGRAADLQGPGGGGDVPGGMRIFNFFDHLKGIYELIYSWADHYRGRGGIPKPIALLNPTTKADHWDHVHVGTGQGGGGAFAGGMASVELPKPPKLNTKLWLEKAADAAMQHTYLQAQQWVNENTFTGPGPGGVTFGGLPGDAGAATGWIRQALGILKAPASWLGPLLARAKQESGFNPRAQNNWDSNAAKGTPSKGLFQTIGPTFNANKLPGYDDIWNPVHNAIAAIRYIMARYGTPFNLPRGGYAKGGLVPGDAITIPGFQFGGLVQYPSDDRKKKKQPEFDEVRGYAHGGIIRYEDIVRVGERNRPEVLIPLTEPGRARQLADESGLTRMLNKTDKSINIESVTVQVTPPDVASPEAYGSSIAHRLTPQLAVAIQRAVGK